MVDQHVDPPEGVQRGLNDRLPAIRRGHAVVVGYRQATEGGDLVDDSVGRGRRGAADIESPTDYVVGNSVSAIAGSAWTVTVSGSSRGTVRSMSAICV